MNSKSKTIRALALLGIFAMSIFVLAACGGNSDDAASSASQESSASSATSSSSEGGNEPANWYQAVLDDENTAKDFPYHKLVDIDQDGTDELFLSSTEKDFIGAEDKAKIVGLVDGNPTDLKEIGGVAGESFSYLAADKALYYFSRLSGEEHYVVLNLENGKLVEKQKFDTYAQNHDPNTGDNKDATYYIDDNEVTEDEYMALYEKYESAEKITYSKDGK